MYLNNLTNHFFIQILFPKWQSKPRDTKGPDCLKNNSQFLIRTCERHQFVQVFFLKFFSQILRFRAKGKVLIPWKLCNPKLLKFNWYVFFSILRIESVAFCLFLATFFTNNFFYRPTAPTWVYFKACISKWFCRQSGQPASQSKIG